MLVRLEVEDASDGRAEIGGDEVSNGGGGDCDEVIAVAISAATSDNPIVYLFELNLHKVADNQPIQVDIGGFVVVTDRETRARRRTFRDSGPETSPEKRGKGKRCV